jgi:MYXO-CTERM domain-containing protein
MLDMAGKRLATAGVFAAAVAAAAVFWVLPKTLPATHSPLIRHMRATVATIPAPHASLASAKSALRSVAHAPAAAPVSQGVLLALALVGIALLLRRQPAPVVARPPRRGRSPPPPRASQHTARTRCH